MKTYKSVLLGASLLATLALAGCASADNEGKDVASSGTEQTQEVKPLYIAKPTVMQVEDDVVDTESLQKNLDAINNGERLPDYTPVNEEERVLEVPENPTFNDEPYDIKDPKELEEGTHIVYVGRDTCPFCNMLRVNLDPVVEQLGLPLGYVDTDANEKAFGTYMEVNFGLQTVPQIYVMHEGEVVASFPQENMYLESGVDYQSLANGLGDLTNIYLSYKYDLPLEGIQDDVEGEVEEGSTEESAQGASRGDDSNVGSVEESAEDGSRGDSETSGDLTE